MTTEDIPSLLDDQDEAMRRWYQGYLRPANEESELTGGVIPPLGRISEIFERWFGRRRDELRSLLCGRLGYSKLTKKGKDITDIAAVAVVTSALTAAHFAPEIDPVATAVILVSRRYLDRLCEGYGD